MPLASIPSPPSGVVLAVWLGERRWVERGGSAGVVTDVASTAVPAGLVGARVYHVVTSPAQYLDHPVDALYVWHGGLGIWGGIAGGALGAWFVLRKRGIAFLPFADALAPCLALAQAVGRIGNYFNQELYGRATDLPWALEIDPEHRPSGSIAPTYHPTFLYELLWNLGVAALVIWADRRWQLGRGRAFALYVAAYCVGRAWIEHLRVDPANQFFGVRLNDYVAGVLFALATSYLVARRGSGREAVVEQPVEADA